MRKYIVIGIVVALLGIAGWVANDYYMNTKDMFINFKNVKEATVIATGDNKSKEIFKTSTSGEKFRVSKNETYLVKYDAVDGYAGGSEKLDVSKDSITIDPYYSDAKLASLLPDEKSAIESAIIQKYPDVSTLYTIKNGRLYHFGEWYGGLLEYKGTAIFNRDNLRIVLKKENGSWSVKTTPPMPSLNIYQQPGIPVDVLKSVDSL